MLRRLGPYDLVEMLKINDKRPNISQLEKIRDHFGIWMGNAYIIQSLSLIISILTL